MQVPELNREKIVNASIAYSLTAARLLVAYNMAKRVRDGNNIAVPMASFVAADILDGVIARKLDADTPGRRFADALIDRASVGLVAYEMSVKHPETRQYLLGIGAREIIVSGANFIHHRNSGEVIQGTGVHKLGTLSLAAFGVVASYGDERATQIVGTLTNVINAGLAIDYVRNAIEPSGDADGGIRKISFSKSDSSASTDS